MFQFVRSPWISSLPRRSRPRRCRLFHPEHLPARLPLCSAIGPTRTKQAPARVSRQRTHTTVFSFSLPQTSQPRFARANGIPHKVEAARKIKCCEEVYAETVQKHKSRACGDLKCFEPSFECNPSVYGNAPRMLRDGWARRQL